MVALTSAQLAALRAVRAAWPDADLILIGAQALGAHIDLSYRETDDLDLAVAVSLEELPGDLAKQPGWARDVRMEQRFRGPAGQTVDLVPAGPRPGTRATLEWPSGHQMSLEGFDLAFAHARAITIEGVRFGLPSAPTLAFLKMRAWLDRPTEREKDLEDLAHLLARYVEEDDVRRWDEHVPEELGFEERPAYLLGHDLRAIQGPHHAPHVEAFLSRVTAARLAAGGPWVLEPTDAAERALEAFRRGHAADAAG